jgi:hypothetical protein
VAQGLDHRASRINKCPTLRQDHINRGAFLLGSSSARQYKPSSQAYASTKHNTTLPASIWEHTSGSLRGNTTWHCLALALLSYRTLTGTQKLHSHRLSVLISSHQPFPASSVRPLAKTGRYLAPMVQHRFHHPASPSANLLNSPKP